MRWMVAVGGVAALLTPVLWAQTPRPGGVATPQPPAPAAAGTGLVLGQVVDGSSGQPIADATVTLIVPTRGAGPGARGAINPGLQAAATAAAFASAQGGSPSAMALPGRGGPGNRLLTDEQGRFVFHDLPAGSFPVQVSAPGYVAGAFGQSRPNGPSRALTLADGQRLGDVKIRLWKFAVASGTVVDELGEPAVGVTVRAMRRSMTNGRVLFATSGDATTDDRGQFRMSRLVPGDYVIAVPQTQVTMPVPIVQTMMDGLINGRGGAMMDYVASGGPIPQPGGRRIGDNLLQAPGQQVAAPVVDGRIGAYLTEFYPAVSAIAQATVVTLQSGEERDNLDMQLRVASTSAVTGTVIGPDGPLAGAPVRLTAVATDEAALGDDFASASTLTRADGTFTMLGVAPGQYVVRVVKLPRPQMPNGRGAGGLGAMFLGDMTSPSPAQTTVPLYGQAAVTLAGADVANVSIQVREGARLSGRVEFSGAAAPPQAQQLQSITVTLNSIDGRIVSASPFVNSPPQAVVDANAQFRTQGYPPGRYSVSVGGSVPSPWAVRSVTVNGRDVLSAPLELSTTDVEGVVITYGDKSTRVSGFVRGLAANANATVLIFPADYKTWLANGMSQRLMRQVTPGTPGAWGAAGLPPGEYLAVALDSADVADTQDPAWFDALARAATRVTLADGEVKTLDLSVARVK